MTGVGDDSRGRSPGAPALVVGFTLAAGATLALVFTEDLRWLRLAIVAALWAALIGAFVAVRYRKQAAATEESVAQAQAVYELELEREIAARREFELEIEAQTRERLEADSREELDALRNEVTALRESLQSLFGGEVLYERVALTAQSTRMRSLNDEPKVVNASEANGTAKPQLTSGKSSGSDAPVERPTEMMDKVRDGEPEYGMARRTPPKQPKPQVAVPRSGQQPPVRKPPAPQQQPKSQQPPPKQQPPKQQPPKQPQRPPVQQPDAAQQRARENQPTQQVPRAPRPPQDSGPPTRRVPLSEFGSAAARAAKAASEARAEAARGRQNDEATVAGMRPAHPQPAQPAQPPPPSPQPQSPSPPDRPVPPAAAQRGSEPPRRQAEPVQQREPEQHELTRPAMERIARGRSAASVDRPERSGATREPEPVHQPEPAVDLKQEFDFEWMSAWTDKNRSSADGSAVASGADLDGVGSSESDYGRAEVNWSDGGGRHGGNGYGSREPEPVPEAGPGPEVPEPNPTLPESVRELQRGNRPGGRRRKPEDDEEPQSFGTSRHGAEASESGSRHGEGGGRRRREEGEPPWRGFGEGDRQEESPLASAGSHAKDAEEGYAGSGRNGHGTTNGRSGRRAHGAADIDPPSGRRAAGSPERADRTEQERGSHAEGRSVSELLAAHGSAPRPRRRRRAED